MSQAVWLSLGSRPANQNDSGAICGAALGRFSGFIPATGWQRFALPIVMQRIGNPKQPLLLRRARVVCELALLAASE